MFKKILSELWTRVVLSYKSTFLGMAVVAADVVAQNLLSSSNVIVHTIAGVVAAILALYRGKAAAPAAPGA